ncbi:unnamed protein product [Phaeothamnion confervicola]
MAAPGLSATFAADLQGMGILDGADIVASAGNEEALDHAAARRAAEIETYKKMKWTVQQVPSCGGAELTFWKWLAKVFPILRQVARVVYAHPTSAAATERDFSHAGNVVSNQRGRLGLV